jgi:monoamine oxidase
VDLQTLICYLSDSGHLDRTCPTDVAYFFSYVIGAKAAKLDEMDAQSRVQQALADAQSLFPDARDHFEAARSKSWSQDPWQLGGLPNFAPGELNFIPLNARREGRILFAGEHTSRLNGWMQGAIESARRVVRVVCE